MIYFLPHWAIGTGALGRLHHRNGKNGEKKGKTQSEEGQGRQRNQGWGPTLSLPISPVVCIEHPCINSARVLVYLGSTCPSSHLTYFPFGLWRRWRLISVTLTMAFLTFVLS